MFFSVYNADVLSTRKINCILIYLYNQEIKKGHCIVEIKGPESWWIAESITISRVVEGVSKVSRLTNSHFTTISSKFFAIYMNIFHKTEVQTVILRC